MAGPWENYASRDRAPLQITVRPQGQQSAQPSGDGPWSRYARHPPPEIGVAEDVAKSAGSGLVKGAIGLAGMPGDVAEYGARGINAATQFVGGKLGLDVAPRESREPSYGQADIRTAVEGVIGKLYEPQTTAGKYAQTIGEFAPGALIGPGGVAARAASVVVPAVASEAAGQLTEGTAWEGPARLGTALVGGVGVGLASRPSTASRAIREAMPEGVTPQMVDDAARLMDDAAQQGITLAWPEALSQVAGRPVLTNAMRHLEAAPQTEGRMAQFFGDRPRQVEGAARPQFDNIAPVNRAPSNIGQEVSRASREAIDNTPEGVALSEAVWRAGPRVSPGDAGAVIQPELRRVYERREGMRSALADADYTAARNAPATIPTNGGYRVADVTKTYLDRPDIPILLDQGKRNAARVKWLDDNSATQKVPILGERPTQFAQVDAAPVLAGIDDALQSAKGSVRQALQAARGALLRADGEIDSTVQGLHNSRKAITDLIDQAKRAGANNAVKELEGTLSYLDDALERVPAYGQARRSFKAASEPLSPFDANRAPGRIIEQDQYGQRLIMPPEDVPGAIQRGGASAGRDFNRVASPAARESFEAHITTQVLDSAKGAGVEMSAGAIRSAIRQNEDLLREFPGVRSRLESIAASRDALDGILAGPLGKIAKRDTTTKAAINALFPANPLANSADEIATTVSALAVRNPRAARDLVRAHVETTFNEAAQWLQTGANQAGGAKFRTALVGNSQQAANLEAAVRALPNGNQIWPGFNRFLDVLEATGTRQGVGSRTAYNAEILKNAAASGMVGEAAKGAANPLRAFQFLADRYERYRLGSNMNELAEILTNPRSVNQLRAIARMPVGSGQAQAVTLRLLTQASASR